MQLTDQQFWEKYWESKDDLIIKIEPDFLFAPVFKRILKENKIQNALEIGGFPGYFSIFLKKSYGINTALLDFYIHRPVFHKLLRANNLNEGDIQVLEADLFKASPQTHYNLVFSCGLIEHFTNTREIVKAHLNFLASGGTLFISVPNLRGLNGWFQKTFDRSNYDKHYLNCMDPAYLKKLCESLGLKDVEAYHYGHFGIWLEELHKHPFLVRVFFKLTWLTGKVISKLIPVESRYFSPYIYVKAINQQ